MPRRPPPVAALAPPMVAALSPSRSRKRAALLAATFVFAVAAPSPAHAAHHRRHEKKQQPPQPESSAAAPDAEAAAPPEPPPPPIVIAEPPDDGKPVVTAVMRDADLGGKVAGEVLDAVGAALARDARFHFHDLGALPSTDAQAAIEIATADEKLAASAAAFDQMDLEKARADVEAAITTYEAHLPLLGAQPRGLERPRDAYIRLAAIRFFAGETDGARDALRHVFLFDPGVDYTPARFPAQMKKMVVESRLLFDAIGPGRLSIASQPEGAVVFVDGVRRGRAPLALADAPPGPVKVTLEKRGFVASVVDVEVAGGGEQASASGVLARQEGDPMSLVESARAEIGANTEPAPLVALSRRLDAPLLVVVKGARTGAGVTLTALLYDDRPRALLRKLVRTTTIDRAANVAGRMATELLANARLDGVIVTPPPLGKRIATLWTSFRGWKWFWPVVGGVAGAAVVGTAVGIGVGVGEHHGLSPAETVILLGTSPAR